MLSTMLRKLPLWAVDEVHVEKAEDTNCYRRLVEWNFNRRLMLMLYVKKTFWNNQTIRERYSELASFYPVGLHVHIAIEPEIDCVSYEKQFEAIKCGVDFLKDCGVTVKDFTAGWFSFNTDTLRVCRELGLKMHIWHGQEWKVTVPVETVRVRRVIHDWELTGERR